MNLIILAVDALRADALTKSKELKSLSKKADAIFSNTISASSFSVPSFASIHTGLYPPSHGLRYQKSGTLGDVPTLAKILIKKNFRTMACAYSVAVCKERKTSEGFHQYIDLDTTNGALFRQKFWKNVCKWWEKEKNKPSYLFLHTAQCHAPYDGKNFTPWNKHSLVKSHLNALQPKEYAKKYWNAVDETIKFFIKPTIDYLLSIRPDTWIFIVGDHGELLFDLSENDKKQIKELNLGNPREYSHGTSLVDILIYAPIILFNIPGINSSNKIKRTVDIVPTITELIGENSNCFHGYSLKNKFAPEIAYSELMDENIIRFTTKKEKLILRVDQPIPKKFKYFMKRIKEIPQTRMNDKDAKLIKERLKSLGYL